MCFYKIFVGCVIPTLHMYVFLVLRVFFLYISFSSLILVKIMCFLYILCIYYIYAVCVLFHISVISILSYYVNLFLAVMVVNRKCIGKFALAELKEKIAYIISNNIIWHGL